MRNKKQTVFKSVAVDYALHPGRYVRAGDDRRTRGSLTAYELPGSGQSDLFPGLRVLVLNVEIDRRQRPDGVRPGFLQSAFRINGQHVCGGGGGVVQNEKRRCDDERLTLQLPLQSFSLEV